MWFNLPFLTDFSVSKTSANDPEPEGPSITLAALGAEANVPDINRASPGRLNNR